MWETGGKCVRLQVSFAECTLERGTKGNNLENLSTVLKTTMLPLDGGSPVTKSMDMWDQGHQGMGYGRRNYSGLNVGSLFCAQVGQAKIMSCILFERQPPESLTDIG